MLIFRNYWNWNYKGRVPCRKRS